ncbi:MAG: DNA-deoxyinosine glycosylase [Longicatena sp.]|nr:DNA-deoxyinosine glycosylase [Longicatena sp.]
MIVGFEPVIAKDTEILILGSMPSVTSLTKKEYYGFAHNRFWKVMSQIYQMPIDTYEEKLNIITSQKLALWDVIHACEREGSLDSAIHNEIVNPIDQLLYQYPSIHTIICNGKKSYQTYMKYFKHLNIKVVSLPSTSNANAIWKLDQLCAVWKENLKK